MKANFTTFSEISSTRTGGEVLLFESEKIQTIQELVLKTKTDRKKKSNLEFKPYIIGACTNIIPRDDIYFRPALRYVKRKINIISKDIDETIYVDVEAGNSIYECVDFASNYGAIDFLPLAGIPGSAGSFPIQNVGAYGVEAKDFVEKVFALNLITGEREEFTKNQCNFQYRNSIFKERRELFIYRIRVRLSKKVELLSHNRDENLTKMAYEKEAIKKIKEYILEIRRRKGTLLLKDDKDTWGVGSFFINPIIFKDHPALQLLPKDNIYNINSNQVKISAASLIELSGFKRGERIDSLGVSISKYHILSLVNNHNAKAEDFLKAARIIQNKVFRLFKIKLSIEPSIHSNEAQY